MKTHSIFGELVKLKETPVVGESYHVAWASRGVMGVCTMVDPLLRVVQLKRPKTRVAFKNLVPFDTLRHTRAQEERINNGLSAYPDRTNDAKHQERLKKFNLK